MPRLNMPGSNGAGSPAPPQPLQAHPSFPAHELDAPVTPFARFLLWERSSRDTLEVKRAYIDMAGDLVAGILLSQIVYWHLPDREGRTRLRIERNGQYWMARSRTEWWDECRVTPKQADRALDLLRKRGLIETGLFRFNGAPTVHLRIAEERFMQSWQAAIEGSDDHSNASPPPVFPQRSKSISPKGQNPSSPKGEIHLPESGKSITESTTETTTETTTTAAHASRSPSAPVVAALAAELMHAGVSRTCAVQLAGRYPPGRIRSQIAMLPFRDAREPAAVLVKAIEEDWAAPEEYRRAEAARLQREAQAAEDARLQREAEAREAAEAARQSARDAWWASQDAGTQSGLMEEAAENVYRSNPGLRRGFINHHGPIFKGLRDKELRKLIDEKMKE